MFPCLYIDGWLFRGKSKSSYTHNQPHGGRDTYWPALSNPLPCHVHTGNNTYINASFNPAQFDRSNGQGLVRA